MNRKRSLTLVALILIISLLTTLTACGKKAPSTLEEYISVNDNRDEVIGNIVAEDPNATVTFEGNTMVFTYLMDDETVTEEMLVNALDSLGDTFSGIIKDLETKTGLEGISVRVVYVNGSGDEITGKVFE